MKQLEINLNALLPLCGAPDDPRAQPEPENLPQQMAPEPGQRGVSDLSLEIRKTIK